MLGEGLVTRVPDHLGPGLVGAVGYVEKMDTRRATDDLTARARIRDSAFRLIATEGARGATLRAIAKEAGVSSPLVLHHFGSKQGVIEAVEEWVQTQLRASTADDGDSSDPSRRTHAPHRGVRGADVC